MTNSVLVQLLIASGILSVFGTLTVAINYATGATVGRMVLRDLEADERTTSKLGLPSAFAVLNAGELDVEELMVRFVRLRRLVGRYLRPRPILVAGIVCYAVVAVLDTVAGVGALVR